MKSKRENQSKSSVHQDSLPTQILCKIIHTNKRMYIALMSRYTKDRFQQDEILSDVVFNFTKLTAAKFAAIQNYNAYIYTSVKHACISYLTKLANRQEVDFDDQTTDAEEKLSQADVSELQQGEMTDMFIDKHREMKAAISPEEFDLLERWGVKEQSYAQIMVELKLTEPQVRTRIYHLRQFIKSKFKVFWRSGGNGQK